MFFVLLVRFRQNHKTLVRSIPTLTVWVWIPLLPPLQFFRPFGTQQNIFLPKKYKNRLWRCIQMHWLPWFCLLWNNSVTEFCCFLVHVFFHINRFKSNLGTMLCIRLRNVLFYNTVYSKQSRRFTLSLLWRFKWVER